MTFRDFVKRTFSAQDRKSLVLAIVITVMALVCIAVLYPFAIRDRVFLVFYFTGITVAAWVLVRRRALALMELVVFTAIAMTLIGVYLRAKPGIPNPIASALCDVTFWAVLLYLGWRLASEAYRFQRDEIRRQVQREVHGKMSAERGIALVTAVRDIHHPLVTMRTITDGMLNEPGAAWEQSQLDSLADLDQNLGHLMVLVHNLLDFGLVESRRIRFHGQPTLVADLIQQAVAAVHAQAAQKRIELHTHVESNVGEIIADPMRLKQVIAMLLSNAVDCSGEGGAVNLHARTHGEELYVSVRDTGKGISDEEIQALFDPYREDQADDHQIFSTLGISLAKRLVEIHGGTMVIDSVPDSGTNFTIRLPLDTSKHLAKYAPASDVTELESPMLRTAEKLADYLKRPKRVADALRRSAAGTVADVAASEEEPEDASEEVTRVLVADANESVRRVLRQWLVGMGCEVVETDKGSEVMELAHARPMPRLILLDVNLPGQDGFRVCHDLKKDTRLQFVPVILVTPDDSPEGKTRAFEAGADDFLVKPIDREELTVRVQSLLRIYRFNQELIGAEGVAMALARAVAAKDGYSQSHVGKVANYAVMLGKRMSMDIAELKSLKYGAILHNVGKISIPDAVLEKQGTLSPREMAMVHQHPEIGCDICAPLKPLKPVLSIIRHHKEHWDGSGYPDRLKGDQIPLGAQIVGLVDAYTALITNRPYRQALSHEKAVEILRKQTADGWYDPQLVEEFLMCVEASEGQPVAPEESAIAEHTAT